MKIVKILLFFVLSINTVWGQKGSESKSNDVVYLRDGSRFVGTIVRYNDTIALKLSTGDTLNIASYLVRKVVMPKPKADEVTKIYPYKFREKGLWGSLNLSTNFGRNSSMWSSDVVGGIGTSAVGGYMFNRFLATGVGVSFDDYYLLNSTSPVLSYFGEVRSYLRQRRVSEYARFAMGYGRAVPDENNTWISVDKGGLMFEPSIGFRFGSRRFGNFTTDFGFRWQRLHFKYSDEWRTDDYAVTYRRWILRLGFVF